MFLRSLSNAEDERDNVKEMNDKLNEQILELADKFEREAEELKACKKKLQEADNLQERLEQEKVTRLEALREAQEKETVLLAQVRIQIFKLVSRISLMCLCRQIESRQAEIDFTKEQLANLRLRLESIKPSDGSLKDENDTSAETEEEEGISDKENQVETLKQRVNQLETQLKTVSINVRRMSFHF